MEQPKPRPLAVLAVLAMAVVAVPAATPLLNGVKPAGLPLGYAAVSQGVPVLLALLVLVVPWARR
jgi:uncharacterized membrane protein